MIRSRSRRATLGLSLLAIMSSITGAHAADPTATLTPLAALQPGGLPDGWLAARTGRGAAAEWAVVADPTARSGSALTQTKADPTDYRYPLAIVPGTMAADVEVTVRFKSVSGRTDQAGGLAIRLRDADNYYVVRANALEDNVRFYRVVRGDRREIGGASARVTSGQWHTLGLRAEADRFTVMFDGKTLFTATDRSFPDAGRVALWTKADSVTRFEALTIAPLAGPGR